MTIRQISLLLVVVILISFGQIFLKISASRVGINGAPSNWLNIWLILGLSTYGVSMLLWLKIIRNIPLSLATPISGLTFVLIPILCAIFLNEKLTFQYFVGAFIIMLGIFIISRGYKYENSWYKPGA